MSAPKRDEALQGYLDRLLALKAARAEDLTPDEMQAIARELGLSDDDLAAGQAAAERYCQKGLGFMRHRRWSDAIQSLTAASALSPGRFDVLHALAQAHSARYGAEREPADKRQAGALARRCLDLQPDHEPSFVLLNTLDAPDTGRARHRLVGGLTAAMVCLVLIGGLAANWRRGQPPQTTPPVTRQDPVAPAAPPLVEVPVTLAVDAKSGGVKLDTRLSQLRNHAQSSFYQQAIALTNTGQTEWQEMALQADYLDAAGHTLDSEPLTVLETYRPSVRPGDIHLFGHLKRSSAQLAGVRLRVVTRREVPIRALKLAAKPLTVTWDVEAPAGVSLSFKERSAAVSRSKLFDTTYAKPVIEVENTGDVTIKTLRLKWTGYDAAGRVIKTNEHLAVSGEGMALPPGEVRADNWHEQVPAGYQRYLLQVVEVD